RAGGFVDEDLPDDEEVRDRGASRHQQLDRRRFRDEEFNAEELAAQLRERYSRDDYTSSGHRGNVEHVAERLKLPDPGKEWNVVLNLMQKGLTRRHDILSVFTRDALKGYVYIEALQPAPVQKSLENVPFAFASTLSLVPVAQMVDVLKVTAKEVTLRPRTWVRVRRGKYANDLAQVLEVSESGETAVVKLVPRLEFKDDDTTDSAKRKAKSRPPQRLFNPEDRYKIEGMRDVLVGRGNTYTVGSDTYRDGYLEKRLKVSALITEDVNATLDEISKFAANDQDEDGESMSLSSLAEPLMNARADPSQFNMGDHVVVTEGALKGAHGIIDRIVDTTADVVVRAGGMKKTTSLPIEALRKRFQQGDHVKVVNGKFKDETGLVVKVAENIVTLISDTTMKEISVFSKDLREAGDITTAQSVSSAFDLHDCVEFLDNQHAGIVVRVDRDYLMLLREDGQVGLVKPHQVAKQKRDVRRVIASDADGNIIRVGDKVKEVGTMGREGVVLYLHRKSAFIHSREVTENSGVFLVRSNELRSLANSGARNVSGMGGDRFARPGPPMQRGHGGGGGGGGRFNHRNDRLVGQTVVITQGRDKGLLGIVKESSDSTARVELHSNARVVAVDKSKLHPSAAAGGGNGYGGSGGSYGSGFGNGGRGAGAQTPFYGASGGKTPNPYSSDGGRTPAWDAGNRTPAWDAGNRTPAWNAGNRTPAWNSGNRTPAWSSSSDNWNTGGATPRRSDGWGNVGQSSSGSSAAFPSTPGPATPGPIPATPGSSAPTPRFPSTPGPHTPSAQQAALASGGDYATIDIHKTNWPLEDVCVRITPHRITGTKWSNGDYDDADAVITRVQSDGTCTLRMSVSRELVQGVPREHMKPIVPEKRDLVKLLVGEHRGKIGELVGVDNMDVIVKAPDMQEFNFLKLTQLGKYQPDV
ncbi:hypothetical protein THASP1DRAFT_16475, partial [Thamnocephalis sphaerospora]